MASEAELPEHVNYCKPTVEACLRDMTDFVFFVSNTTELVSLEDITTRPITGKGTVLSQLEGTPPIATVLDEILEWFVEFAVTREQCAIWVKTNTASYRLQKPDPTYVSHFHGLANRFNITAEIFFSLYHDPNSSYDTVITRLCCPPFNMEESSILAEATFILHHLKSHPDTATTPFLLALEKKRTPQGRTTINSMASAASFAAAMESRDDSEIQRTTIDLEFSDTLSFGRKRIDSPLNTSNPLMTSAERERPLTRGERAGRERDASTSLRTTQEFSLDILRNIPRIYLNERGRFQCYICQITFPKHDINEYKNHLHKHRTNMVCVFSEKERMALRYLSFLNQLRVRSFIENQLAPEGPTNQIPTATTTTTTTAMTTTTNTVPTTGTKRYVETKKNDKGSKKRRRTEAL